MLSPRLPHPAGEGHKARGLYDVDDDRGPGENLVGDVAGLNRILELRRGQSGGPGLADQFFSFSAFYYKQGKANELALFNQVKQSDCSTIEILSTSREILTYKIIENSELHIRFQLQNKWSETMSKKQKEALYGRIQPYEYTVIYASKNNLKIIEKYTTVDPLCDTKNLLKFELTKYISWAQNENELPSRYEIDSNYYEYVKSAVAADFTAALPELDLARSLATAEIKNMMVLPIRNELKLCN